MYLNETLAVEILECFLLLWALLERKVMLSKVFDWLLRLLSSVTYEINVIFML